jgi:hypothetical protein
VAAFIARIRVDRPRLLGTELGRSSSGDGDWRPGSTASVWVSTNRHFVAIQVAGHIELLEYWPDKVGVDLVPVDAFDEKPWEENRPDEPYDEAAAVRRHNQQLASRLWFLDYREDPAMGARSSACSASGSSPQATSGPPGRCRPGSATTSVTTRGHWSRDLAARTPPDHERAAVRSLRSGRQWQPVDQVALRARRGGDGRRQDAIRVGRMNRFWPGPSPAELARRLASIFHLVGRRHETSLPAGLHRAPRPRRGMRSRTGPVI